VIATIVATVLALVAAATEVPKPAPKLTGVAMADLVDKYGFDVAVKYILIADAA